MARPRPLSGASLSAGTPPLGAAAQRRRRRRRGRGPRQRSTRAAASAHGRSGRARRRCAGCVGGCLVAASARVCAMSWWRRSPPAAAHRCSACWLHIRLLGRQCLPLSPPMPCCMQPTTPAALEAQQEQLENWVEKAVQASRSGLGTCARACRGRRPCRAPQPPVACRARCAAGRRRRRRSFAALQMLCTGSLAHPSTFAAPHQDHQDAMRRLFEFAVGLEAEVRCA